MAFGGKRLDTGDPLPALSVESVGHGVLSLPQAFAGRWGVLLVYRAHW